MRKLLFNLHWFLGITAGFIIVIVGVTGAMLSFQPQILTWLNPGIITVQPTGTPKTPEQLMLAVTQQAPEKNLVGLTITQSAELAYSARFAPQAGQRRGEMQYLNQYTGELLGQPQGREFFIDVMRLHRWLLAGDVGKQVVAISTIILLFMSITGIYLRWPKGAKKWQPGYWLKLRKTKTRRAFWWQLHAVVGTWVLPLYVLASVTGLYWSYDWYREALFTISGVEQPSRQRPAEPSVPAAAGMTDQVWNAFQQQDIHYQEATLHLPIGKQAQVSYLAADATHNRQTNQIVFDVENDLQVLSVTRFLDKPLNERLMGSMLPLHSGEYFGFTGLVLMMIASLIMPLFFITGIYLYLVRKKAKRGRPAVTGNPLATGTPAKNVSG